MSLLRRPWEEEKERKTRRKPLYLEVIDFLTKDIRSEKYLPGSKLPSEEHLAHEFSVSRVTLREALRVLEEDGMIVRRHGTGTFVLDRKTLPIQSLSTIISISAMFKKAGLEDHFEKAVCKKLPATRRIAEKLQISSGDEVWEVERLRTFEKRPAVYSLDFFPASFVPSKEEGRLMDYKHSIYLFLHQVCGQNVEKGHCILKPVLSDANFSAVMKIPRGAPLMYIETIDLNKRKQPILYAQEYYRPDFFEFRVKRQRETPGPHGL